MQQQQLVPTGFPPYQAPPSAPQCLNGLRTIEDYTILVRNVVCPDYQQHMIDAYTYMYRTLLQKDATDARCMKLESENARYCADNSNYTNVLVAYESAKLEIKRVEMEKASLTDALMAKTEAYNMCRRDLLHKDVEESGVKDNADVIAILAEPMHSLNEALLSATAQLPRVKLHLLLDRVYNAPYHPKPFPPYTQETDKAWYKAMFARYHPDKQEGMIKQHNAANPKNTLTNEADWKKMCMAVSKALGSWKSAHGGDEWDAKKRKA